jgi:hypothetical protein
MAQGEETTRAAPLARSRWLPTVRVEDASGRCPWGKGFRAAVWAAEGRAPASALSALLDEGHRRRPCQLYSTVMDPSHLTQVLPGSPGATSRRGKP